MHHQAQQLYSPPNPTQPNRQFAARSCSYIGGGGGGGKLSGGGGGAPAAAAAAPAAAGGAGGGGGITCKDNMTTQSRRINALSACHENQLMGVSLSNKPNKRAICGSAIRLVGMLFAQAIRIHVHKPYSGRPQWLQHSQQSAVQQGELTGGAAGGAPGGAIGGRGGMPGGPPAGTIGGGIGGNITPTYSTNTQKHKHLSWECRWQLHSTHTW